MSKRKLLLADDSITIQKVVNLTFADEGVEVIAVGDGDAAMHKFDEFMPDLVMADVNMPGLSGYEICQIIKQNDETRHIPVILLVGSFEPFDEEVARNAGADDYLTKPFQSIRQLVNKVSDLLAASAGATSDVSAPDDDEPTAAAEADAPTPSYDEPTPAYADAAPAYDEAPAAHFDETLRYDEPVGESSDFGDAGMDDEMIEASTASDFGVSPVDEDDSRYGKTQPLSAADLHEFRAAAQESAGLDEAAAEAPSVDDASEEPAAEVADETDTVDDSSLYDYPSDEEKAAASAEAETEEAAVADDSDEPVRVTDDESDESQAAVSEEIEEGRTTEDAVEAETADEPEADAEEAEQVTETEEADEPVAETEAAEAEPTAVVEAETEAPVAEAETEAVADYEPAAEPVAEAVAAPPQIDFDEGDVLELPPLVEETGIRARTVVQAAPEAPAVEPAAVPEAAATEAVAEAPAADSGTSFPPELIDAIARRVAEQISAKTLSDILPQITDLVVKKLTDEKKD